MFVNKKCHSFLRNDTLYNILFLYFYLKFLAATWANGGMGAYSVRKSQNRLAFGTFSCPGFGLSAAIGAIVYAEATLIVTLLAGIFLVTQLSAAISAKHMIHTFLFL